MEKLERDPFSMFYLNAHLVMTIIIVPRNKLQAASSRSAYNEHARHLHLMILIQWLV